MRSVTILFAAATLGIAASAAAATVEVHMKSAGAKMHFVPDIVTIKKGDTVKWVNDDPTKQLHTVTSGKIVGAVGKADKLFDSKMLTAGKTFEHTFTEAGSFDYFCVPHVAMKMFGKVIVK